MLVSLKLEQVDYVFCLWSHGIYEGTHLTSPSFSMSFVDLLLAPCSPILRSINLEFVGGADFTISISPLLQTPCQISLTFNDFVAKNLFIEQFGTVPHSICLPCILPLLFRLSVFICNYLISMTKWSKNI